MQANIWYIEYMTNIQQYNIEESFKTACRAPKTMADLIRASIKDDWVSELDMETLGLVPTEDISKSLGSLRSHLTWRVRSRKEKVWIYIILEFQSKPDPTMPLHMVEYVAALYRSLIDGYEIDTAGPYPPVYPLVIYLGTQPWLAHKNTAANLGSLPAGLRPYNLSLGCAVVDVYRMAADLPADTENLAEAMFRVQGLSRSEDVVSAAVAMLEMLDRTERSHLWRVFRPWLWELLLLHFPNLRWPKRDSMAEILALLRSETIVAHGPRREVECPQGIEQGASALRETLNTLARVRFGQPVAALVEDVVANISELDKLAEVGRWIGECDTGETLLARLRQP